MSPTPIFVVGLHRSGTTWLSNHLSQHPDVAAVTSEPHGGIIESKMFCLFDGRCGDLSDRSNFDEFVDLFADTQYYEKTGLPRSFLEDLYPTTYPDLFRAVMDRYAREQGASHWLEKTPEHALRAREIAGWYPDARFVGISRDPTWVANSYVAWGDVADVDGGRVAGLRGSLARAFEVAKVGVRWSAYHDALEALARERDGVHLTTYEALDADLEGTLREVVEALDLPWDPAVLENPYRANTSFDDLEERSLDLSSGEARLEALARRVAGGLPLGVRRSLVCNAHKPSHPLADWLVEEPCPG